jgi:hypothetical protein
MEDDDGGNGGGLWPMIKVVSVGGRMHAREMVSG